MTLLTVITCRRCLPVLNHSARFSLGPDGPVLTPALPPYPSLSPSRLGPAARLPALILRWRRQGLQRRIGDSLSTMPLEKCGRPERGVVLRPIPVERADADRVPALTIHDSHCVMSPLKTEVGQ